MFKNSLRILMVLLLAITLSSYLSAQGRLQGSVNGKVSDSEGNPLPGCTVTLEGPNLQGQMTFVTTEAGTYRFPAVPPGENYQLTFEMPGFKTTIRQGLKVSIGKGTTINIGLDMSAIEEEVTVVGESPTVDVKTSKTAVNYSKSYIYNIPMSRDLYDVLNSMPGSVSEGVTYRRTSYISGSTVRGNQYSMDGVTINDPVVMYPMTNINVDVYEEVEMGMFGHSAEVGIADGGFINIVTKSGGNEFHGGGTVEYYDENFVENLLSEEDLEAVGQTAPSGWNYWQDFSLFFGGPIIKDKIWFFTNGRYFQWARDFNHRVYDDSIAQGTRVYTLDEAPHKEIDAFAKLTFQLSPNIRWMLTYNLANITEEFYTNNIGSNLDVTATTKWDGEVGHTVSSQLNWVLGQNLFIDARFGYVYRWFPIPYSDYAVADAPQYNERYYNIIRNNPRFNETYLRTRLNPSVIATFFQDNLLGASHEIKIGAEYEYTTGNWDWWRQNPWTVWFYKGDIYAYATSTIDNRGQIYCRTAGNNEGDTTEHEAMQRFGVFVQDSVTIVERLTLNFGLRFDTSKGFFPEQHHSAVNDPWDLLPVLKGDLDAWDEYSLPKTDILAWTHISPRLGFAYDLFGDGKTSIRGSWSRYNEYLMIQYFSVANPMYPNGATWYWIDTDYDRVIEPTDEFVNQYLPPGAFDFDIDAEMDKDATAPYTDEFTLGFEREVAKDFSVSVAGIYKHKRNIFEDVNDFGLGKDEAWKGYQTDSPYWEKFEFADPGDDGVFGTADDITSYCYARLDGAPGIHYYHTNVDNGYRKYMALQIIFNKRMSNRWQLMGSVVWSKSWGNIGGSYGNSWGSSGAFDTPNSFVYSDGRLDFDRPLNIKLQTTVILPLDFIVSGYFNHRSGSPWNRTITVYIPDDPKYKYPGNSIFVPTEENGTRRNPPITTLDLRLEKRFRIGESFSIGGYIDVLNALGRSGYDISANPGGYLDYSDPSNPTFERYGNYGTITGAYGNRTLKFSLRFTF